MAVCKNCDGTRSSKCPQRHGKRRVVSGLGSSQECMHCEGSPVVRCAVINYRPFWKRICFSNWCSRAVAVLLVCHGIVGSILAQNFSLTDVSPTTRSFSRRPQHSVSGRVLSLTVSTDGRRLYAGTVAGVWRSDDAGATWRQLTLPQPPANVIQLPNALLAPNVFDVVVSPGNPDVVLAATGGDTRIFSELKDGVYRSVDGGNTWEFVYEFTCGGQHSAVGQIVFAPDNPSLIYVAGGCAVAVSTDTGKPGTWTETKLAGGTVWHLAVAPGVPHAGRWVYAAGENQVWFSENGGRTWSADKSFFIPPYRGESPPGGLAGIAAGSSARILALEPGRPDHLYFAVPGLTNGRSYYHNSKEGPNGSYCNLLKFADADANSIWMPNEGVIRDSNNNSVYGSGDLLIAGNAHLGQLLTTDRSGPENHAAFKYVDSNGNNEWNPGETLVFDANNDSKYGYREPVIVGFPPSMGAILKPDASGPGNKSVIKFVDANHDNMWNSGETVALDANDNGWYDTGETIVSGISPGSRPPLTGNPGGAGSQAAFKFVDANNDNAWNPAEAMVLDLNDNGIYDTDVVIKGERPMTGANLKLPRPCGEGSLWLGDYSRFRLNGSIQWTQLPGPPTYFGTSTPSGNAYVVTKATPTGHLVFFSDRSHVHVSEGQPTSTASWYRLDGRNVSQAWIELSQRNKLYMHADPHSLVLSSDFVLTLKEAPRVRMLGTHVSEIPSAYRQNKVVKSSSGTIWMSNDGGVYYGSGSSSNWRFAKGLSTLSAVNLAGLAIRGKTPALYMGTGDNDDFYSLNGGRAWGDPVSDCGDCGTWFADAAQPSRVLSAQREGSGESSYLALYNSRMANRFPDPSALAVRGLSPVVPVSTDQIRMECPAKCSISYSNGSRPLIQTLYGEVPPLALDFLLIGVRQNGRRVVFRKKNSSAIRKAADWENPYKAEQYGPDLCDPTTITCQELPVDVVQTSGGHTSTVVYVGDPYGGKTLWKWQPGSSNWQKIVPSPPGVPAGQSANVARRFFASPYDPTLIYILDDGAAAGVKRSEDGGRTWLVDSNLTDAVTEYGFFAYDGDGAVLKDMIFDRKEPSTRFAIGNVGVFYTLDGKSWTRLFTTKALPSHPIAAYFDPISDSNNRSLYVAFAGRGIIRISPIPFPPPIP
jgi:photosystem II stability/assembly factor-like uncharacterized protein